MAKITEEIRQRLEENGIPEITYQHSIYRGDDAYEASTRQTRKKTMTPEIKANIEKNNIKNITYWQRVQHGMSAEEASTKAIHTSTKLNDEQRSIMKKNGIKPSTVSKPVAGGWTVEKAIG